MKICGFKCEKKLEKNLENVRFKLWFKLWGRREKLTCLLWACRTLGWSAPPRSVWRSCLLRTGSSPTCRAGDWRCCCCCCSGKSAWYRPWPAGGFCCAERKTWTSGILLFPYRQTLFKHFQGRFSNFSCTTFWDKNNTD